MFSNEVLFVCFKGFKFIVSFKSFGMFVGRDVGKVNSNGCFLVVVFDFVGFDVEFVVDFMEVFGFVVFVGVIGYFGIVFDFFGFMSKFVDLY